MLPFWLRPADVWFWTTTCTFFSVLRIQIRSWGSRLNPRTHPPLQSPFNKLKSTRVLKMRDSVGIQTVRFTRLLLNWKIRNRYGSIRPRLATKSFWQFVSTYETVSSHYLSPTTEFKNQCSDQYQIMLIWLKSLTISFCYIYNKFLHSVQCKFSPDYLWPTVAELNLYYIVFTYNLK